MKTFSKINYLLFFTLFTLLHNNIISQDTTIVQHFIKQTNISGQWFLSQHYNITDNLNQFMLKRGYFTIKTQISPNFSVRYTQDITLDQEGTDAGNVEIRLKYLYMKFKGSSNTVLKNSYAEFGLVHRPFVDFEQKINNYRVQGSMFSERYDLLSSADFGITIGGNIGGKLSESIQKKIGKDYAGKYGSYSFGIYNGGGYHAIEYNNNKVFEGRLSIRPFPNFAPGLQFSYINAFGTSNLIDTNINFNVHLFFLSFKNSNFTLTGQTNFGSGNYDGDFKDENYTPLKNNGFSIFSEVFLIKSKLSLIGKYDNFILYQQPFFLKKEAIVGGISFHFLNSKLLLFYENDFSNYNFSKKVVELVLEIGF